MQKLKLFGIFLAFFASLGFVSCGDDEMIQWDFNPVIARFEIVDADGNSLIARDEPLHGADFSVTYNDKDYPADWETYTYGRYFLPTFKGLYYSPELNGGGPWLDFGDFKGEDCEGSFTLNLPDGTKHTVTFNRYIKVKGKNTKVTQTVTFDGKVVSEYTNGIPFYNFKIVYNVNP